MGGIPWGRDTGCGGLSMLISPRMLKTLKELDTLSSEAKATAFQHLLLLVGIHLFQVRPEVEGLQT